MNMAKYNVARKSWIRFNPLSNVAEPMDPRIGPAASMRARILLNHALLLEFQTPTPCSKYQNLAAKTRPAPLVMKVARWRLPELWALRSTVR